MISTQIYNSLILISWNNKTSYIDKMGKVQNQTSTQGPKGKDHAYKLSLNMEFILVKTTLAWINLKTQI